MRKTVLFLLFMLSPVQAKEFSEQIIMIKPVSWEELQGLHLTNNKNAEDLNLSGSCPTELAAFEKLKAKSTFFKEILWSHYYWTEFENIDGLTCVIKHETFDFFSKNDQESPLKRPGFEILEIHQAMILLNAANEIGFDEYGILTLKRHIHFHNQAIQEKPFKKYGGSVRMTQFMMANPQEITTIQKNDDDRKFVDNNGVVAYKMLDPVVVFESKYKKETLAKLAKKIEEERKLESQDSIYPFSSFEELLEQSQKDIKFKKKTLTNSNSSTIYQISNENIVQNNGNGTYSPFYPYASIGYLQNGDYCGGSYAGTDYVITSHVTLTAAHNIVCNNERSTFSFSNPGALKPTNPSGFPTSPFGNFYADNVVQPLQYQSNDNLNQRAQYDYGGLRSVSPFTFTQPITLQIDLSTDDVRVVGFPNPSIGSTVFQGMHEGNDTSFVSGNFFGNNVLTYSIETKKLIRDRHRIKNESYEFSFSFEAKLGLT